MNKATKIAVLMRRCGTRRKPEAQWMASFIDRNPLTAKLTLNDFLMSDKHGLFGRHGQKFASKLWPDKDVMALEHIH